jgi:DNA-binding response OmpR family regulator
LIHHEHRLKILVVEDDKKVTSFLEKGLREEGCSVDVAHNGEDGLLKGFAARFLRIPSPQ